MLLLSRAYVKCHHSLPLHLGERARERGSSPSPSVPSPKGGESCDETKHSAMMKSMTTTPSFPKSTKTALILSGAVFPGIGQWYLKRTVKGVALVILSLVSLLG